MNSRNDIQRELELQNSSLPFDVHMPVFDLPQGYFENFAAEVLARIKGTTAATAAEEMEGLSPLLAGLSKKTPYSLPADYFTQNLASGTLREEDSIPGWAAEGRQNPYSVPAGYFSQVSEQVWKAVKPQPAKVISMGSRRWMQYAAAAVLAGALVLGGILYQQKPSAVDPANDPDDWVAHTLDQVSNQELEAFIMSTEVSGNEMAQQKGNTKEVRTVLKDVSSSELDAFLNQLPAETELIN
ncbi:hypothetical protein SAMN05444008_12727 [Cnuella takakiae]|uniref:Uncharacterized protein n=1 Tax=Cnuella takakiae TaxID=1302690 RepID=A0A1M5J2R4_9BACT|nr:hypothetical protein [Cnuella takakiae]OLY91325.1 hypothetical protein BUE76_04990 [Cnuella takakiae]SHG34811.1 hypothetical protein SAMN05444008_12727 [Cnuella takakiae]